MEGWGDAPGGEGGAETGAEVILLTESDHFIYLQQGRAIKSPF